MWTLAESTTLIVTLAFLMVVVSILMIFVIIVQKPRGGGLSGAFGGGGAGSADAAFGSKAGNLATWLTIIAFVAFLLIAVSLSLLIEQPTSAIDDGLDVVTPQTTRETATPAAPTGADGEATPADRGMDFLEGTSGNDEDLFDDVPAGTFED